MALTKAAMSARIFLNLKAEYGAVSNIPDEGDQAGITDQDPLINLKRLSDAIAEGVVDSIQTDATLSGFTENAVPSNPHQHILGTSGGIN